MVYRLLLAPEKLFVVEVVRFVGGVKAEGVVQPPQPPQVGGLKKSATAVESRTEFDAGIAGKLLMHVEKLRLQAEELDRWLHPGEALFLRDDAAASP
jgi:hypothetical protein